MQNQTMWFRERFRHYRVPKELFDNSLYSELSPLARLLYALLLDRTCLSATNGDVWLDTKGRYYVYMTIREISELCCCGHDKASRLLKELEGAHLIERTIQGRCRPNKIVVLPFQQAQNSVRATDNQTSGVLETSDQDVRKFDTNDTDTNNTLLSNTDSSYSYRRDMLRNMVLDNISYDVLIQEMDDACLSGIVNLIVEVLSSRKSTIRILGEDLPREQVEHRFRALDDMHIRYVYDRIQCEKRHVNNPRGYILARLYEAEDVMDTYYQTRVQHDFCTEG